MTTTKLRASSQINNDSEFIQRDGNVAMNADLDLGSNKITSLASPTGDNDVANKSYVDGVAEGLTVKDAVRVKSNGNSISLSSDVGTGSNTNPGNAQVDSQWLNRKDRVLLTDQGTGSESENGIYHVPDESTALRSEFNLDSGLSGNELRVQLDSSNDIHTEVKISDPNADNTNTITINTTASNNPQTSPHQVEVILGHDGNGVTSTVDDVKDAIDNDDTASGWITPSVLQGPSETIDVFGGGGGTGWVNMGVYNGGNGLQRTPDFDSGSVSRGAFTFVEEGTHSDKGFVMTSENVNLGTDALSFTQFSGAGQITAGDGLTKSGDTIDAEAADDSITMNSNDFGVNITGALELNPTGGTNGIGLQSVTSGDIFVGQGTSANPSAKAVGGDVAMDNTASFTVQTTGTNGPSGNGLIFSSGSGIQLKQIPSGNILVGQGTSSNDGTDSKDVKNVALSGEADALGSDGSFTLRLSEEDFSGSTDGSTTDFVVSNPPIVSGKESVYLNGSFQRRDKNSNTYDYSITSGTNTNDTISMTNAPDSSDVLIVRYIHT